MTRWLFVYGTLQPGELRWPSLEPLLTTAGAEADALPGRLYSTPYGYPAAVLSATSDTLVPGVLVELDKPATALKLLDDIEGTRSGLFARQLVEASRRTCWVYAWPHEISPDFVRIPSWPCSGPDGLRDTPQHAEAG